MDHRRITPAGLAMLDTMIGRAEVACERGRRRMEAPRPPPRSKASQQTMEETLARPRAQREAATV